MNKNINLKFIAMVSYLFFCGSAFAYADNEQSSGLNSILKQALASNPEIIYAKKAFESSQARIPQSSSLKDPEFGYEHDKMLSDRMLSGEPMNVLFISQEIPFPSKLYLQSKITSKYANIAYENYKLKEQEIISLVKKSYYELLFVYQAIAINDENKEVLNQIYKTLILRYGSGQGTQSDALKIQVELAKADGESILLEQKLESLKAKINTLLNKNPQENINISLDEFKPDKINHTQDDFIDMAKNNNNELKIYKYSVERGKLAYELALNGYLPDFSLKFKQMISKDFFENDEWSAMIGITLPLWFFKKQAFNVDETKSEIEMLDYDYKNKENTVIFEINDAYSRALANEKLINLYETAFIPQGQEAVNVALKSYLSNKSDFLSVLDSRRMLINFKLEYLTAMLNFKIALADLEKLTGTI